MKIYDNSQKNDAEICRLLKSDAMGGMELMFRIYYTRLVVWANSLLADADEAEDLVQDFFTSIWAKDIYKRLQPLTLRSFLYTSVRNLCLNQLQKRKTSVKNAHDINQLLSLIDDFGALPETIFAAVNSEIENLSERSRQIIYAVFSEGRKYADVAAQYGISLSTVKTTVQRAILVLRNRLRSIDMGD